MTEEVKKNLQRQCSALLDCAYNEGVSVNCIGIK